jgi:hypothetical protein
MRQLDFDVLEKRFFLEPGDQLASIGHQLVLYDFRACAKTHILDRDNAQV